MELPRTQYSREFRKESVKFFKESGLTLVEAAKRLSLPEGALKNRVYADKRGELAAAGKHRKPPTEVGLELSGVKRELAEAKMERDFIKKCATYFAGESRRDTVRLSRCDEAIRLRRRVEPLMFPRAAFMPKELARFVNVGGRIQDRK